MLAEKSADAFLSDLRRRDTGQASYRISGGETKYRPSFLPPPPPPPPVSDSAVKDPQLPRENDFIFPAGSQVQSRVLLAANPTRLYQVI